MQGSLGLGHRNSLQDLADNKPRVNPLDPRLRFHDHPVNKSRPSNLLYIIRYDKVSTVEDRSRPSHLEYCKRASRTSTNLDLPLSPRCLDNIRYISENIMVNMDHLNSLLKSKNRCCTSIRLQLNVLTATLHPFLQHIHFLYTLQLSY